MPGVLQFPTASGSHLLTLRLVRRANGQIGAEIVEMPAKVIDATGRSVPERMRSVAKWTSSAAIDLLRQARLLEFGGHDNDG